MTDVESPGEEPGLSASLRSAAEDSPSPSAPGQTAGRTYGRVVRTQVLDKVKEARRATMESKPDILGVRGPRWNDSVAPPPGKHHSNYTANLLSNTITPDLLNAKDVRTLLGTTSCRPDKHAGTPERTLRPSCEPGGWNGSTSLPGSTERQRQLQAATTVSLEATRRKSPSPGQYIDPVARQTAFSETIRHIKANSGADVAELTARYGPEGAVAMQQIMAMPQKETKPQLRTTHADLEAVKALDAFAHGEEPEEEQGEMVPLGLAPM